MKKLRITLLLSIITCSVSAQDLRWSGDDNLTSTISRNGSIGVNGLYLGRYGSSLVGDSNPYTISTSDNEMHDLMLYGNSAGTLHFRLYDGNLKLGPNTTPNTVLFNSGSAFFSGNLGIGALNPDAKLHIYDNNRDYKVNKPIPGSSEDSQGINYILLHKVYEGVNLADHYVMGKITGIRGGGSLWNRKFTVEVNTASAFQSNRGSVFSYNEVTRLVTVTYAGVKYLALEIPNGSSIYYFSFTGYAQNEKLEIVYDQQISNPEPFITMDPVTINGNHLFVKGDGNVGIGTTNPDAKLAVKGTIHAEEVKVDLQVPGPDYVFEPTYQLPSLKEIENYIKANKHLPEVPSAKKMETNGINLSEMNMLLLKKVEELTLYIIEQERRIQKLESKK